MLIVMHALASAGEIEQVCEAVRGLGLRPAPLAGPSRTAIGVLGNEGPLDPARFLGLAGVAEVVPVSAPYKRVSREWQSVDSVFCLPAGPQVGPVEVGGAAPLLIAGPCAVENAAQMDEVGSILAKLGCKALRAGAYKPRTSPYAFQGLGPAGLDLLERVRDAHGFAIVTEALDEASATAIAGRGFSIQIGARNMQNYALLRHVGGLGVPVVLKRGPSATLSEWLLAAEYIIDAGNPQVLLCERGVRGFDPSTRNLLDLAAVAMLRRQTHLPVLADPSHGTGRRELVRPMARAALAAGANGLLVEMHPQPEKALSDGAQSLRPEQLAELVADMDRYAALATA